MGNKTTSKRMAELACSHNIKPDLVSGSLDISDECKRRIVRQREIEKHLVPLVIDKRTTIMVTPDKCNDAYAQAYRERWNNPQKNTLGPLDVRT